MKKLLLIFIAVTLLTGCVRYSGGEPVNKPKKEEPKEEEVKKEEPVKELTIEGKITQQINKKLGEKNNMKKDRIVKLEVNDHAGTEVEGDKIILLTLNGDENLSAKMSIKGMLMDSGKTFQEAFKNEEVEEIALFWQFPLVDAYGKTTDENVIKITLSKETFEKIEWKSFNYDNFEVVADDYWMHQALTSELK